MTDTDMGESLWAESAAPNSSRLVHLDSLRAVAICMVVAIHARGYFPLSDSAESVIGPIVSLIAVPSFFLCDGFLFVRGQPDRPEFDYPKYVLRSAKRLLAPWIAFSFFYSGFRLAFELSTDAAHPLVLGHGFLDFCIAFYGSEFSPQLYFLLSLFMIRSLAFATRSLSTVPLPALWVAVLSLATSYQTFLAPALQSAIPLELDPLRHAVWGLQFYLWGALLARLGPFVSLHAGKLTMAAIAGCWLAQQIGPAAGGITLLQHSYLLAAYLVALRWTRNESGLTRFGRESMGIYLLHTPILLKAAALAVGMTIGKSLAGYVVAILATTAVAFALTRSMQRFAIGRTLLGMPAVAPT